VTPSDKTTAEFFESLGKDHCRKLNYMMDNARIQQLVETHKMPILQGLAWLKKY
jgi:hypothetical protein